jgi:hypothetical protein
MLVELIDYSHSDAGFLHFHREFSGSPHDSATSRAHPARITLVMCVIRYDWNRIGLPQATTWSRRD